ncbi:uncharacterized protein LOC143301988, partial [Babylonia areolata]|uniref:uncharacterized protein LOC143301988 n=1 Tax=Babylonia areolata TaxID=304850 RepID=UPI003FCF966D
GGKGDRVWVVGVTLLAHYNIITFVKSLKLSWIRKLYTGTQTWRQILLKQCPEIINLNCYEAKRFIKSKCNHFWKDVFVAFDQFNNHVKLQNYKELVSEPIFYNDKFKVGIVDFCFNDWAKKNVYLVKDVLSEDGGFLSHEQFCKKWNIRVKYLHYQSCTQAIKQYIKKERIVIINNESNQNTKALDMICRVTKGSRTYYNILLDWKTALELIKKTKEIKLKWFQIRICFRILVTNSILRRMGLTESEKCNFCNIEKDTIHHYLWECNYIQSYWLELETLLKDKCQVCERLSFNTELVLFGTDDKTKTDEVLNLIILWANFFIYKSRINKIRPTISAFVKEVQYNYRTEKYVSRMEMRYNKFEQKWFPYMGIINDLND